MVEREYPSVIVLIITYRRMELAVQTIRSIKDRLIYPNIGFHIADDGSGYDYVKALAHEIGPTYEITTSDSARAGVGANMNLGIEGALARADHWLHLEDDWVLPQTLDLTPCVDVLTQDEEIGMVRLGRLTAGLDAETYSSAGYVWWRLERKSDTYVYSGNAALKHRRFHDKYGPYKEQLTPGKTELWYCNRFNITPTGPDILWPSHLATDQVFYHIGDSQSFKWWMETGGKTAEQAADMFAEEGKDS